jgi:hypothetical protein
MQDPVPAIAEADATGEVAAIFADIRAVLGVGVVNLIWRHLATIPGALPWAWSALRPRYVDGSLVAATAALRVPALDLSAIPSGALAADDLAGIAAVEATYGRTNPLALVALTALQQPGPGAPLPAVLPGVRNALPLPPLPASLAPETEALVWRLNALGARPVGGAPPVLASMYRHLGYWPHYLALAEQQLAPAAADGSLAEAIAACRAEAARCAAMLPIEAGPPPEPARVAEALDRFAGEVLPRMVVVCAALSATLPGC